MIDIEVLKGDLTKGAWIYDKKEFFIYLKNIQTIPMYDVINIQITQEIDKYSYVNFQLGTGQSFTGRIEKEHYKSLYEDFLLYGNAPKNQVLPLVKETVLGKPVDNQMEDEPEEATKPNNKYIVIIIVLIIVGFFTSLNGNDKTTKANTSYWTITQKAQICKAYIGKLMGKPVTIMEHDNTDSNGNVYINYIRSDDNTKWRYACGISEKEVSWAGYLKDDDKWGRWRNEDIASIEYSKSNNHITLTIPNSGKVSFALN